MRIAEIILADVGPLGTRSLSLHNEWVGKTAELALFSGPNGCGKSILLKGVSVLWQAAGHWLDHREILPQSHPCREWLQQWRGFAIVLSDADFAPASQCGLVWGEPEWAEKLRTEHPDAVWLGETKLSTGKPGKPPRKLVLPADAAWLDHWAEARKQLILTHEPGRTPNCVHLDAEQRRWVAPRRSIGNPVSDSSEQRWLVTYQATEDWRGQLEASLLALKTSEPERFEIVIKDLNRFLRGKQIDLRVRSGENRLRVNLATPASKEWHTLDELSAGEHQVLIMLYTVSRWLEHGGIVLIDEPDLHLHPSLISDFLTHLENLVRKRSGQLLLTSHMPTVWERYQTAGSRLDLTTVGGQP